MNQLNKELLLFRYSYQRFNVFAMNELSVIGKIMHYLFCLTTLRRMAFHSERHGKGSVTEYFHFRVFFYSSQKLHPTRHPC